MTGTLRFAWNSSAASDQMQGTVRAVLLGVQPEVQDVWNGIVPVRTGRLKASWFSRVEQAQRRITLVIGASAPYAIFVELGTIHMAPRAPLRRTAGVAVLMIRSLLSPRMRRR